MVCAKSIYNKPISNAEEVFLFFCMKAIFTLVISTLKLDSHVPESF